MSALISKMVIFVVLMLIGYFGAHMGVLNEEFTKAASKLTINVFMVATILNSVISNAPDISGRELRTAVLVCFFAVFIMYLLGIAFSRLFRVGDDKKAQFMLLIAVVNNMFVGLPIAQQLYGNTAVFYMALTNIPYNLILYSYGVWKLADTGAGGFKVKNILSAPLISTLTALLIFITRIQMPDIIKDMCTIMGNATLPISMLVVGASLGRVKAAELFKERSIFPVALARLFISPLIIIILLNLFGIDGVLAGTMTIFSACPTGIIVTVLSIKYGKDAEYTSSSILLSTALSMFTIPLIVYYFL